MARYYYNNSYYDYLQYLSFPIHFFFFLTVLFLFLSFTWYINYESKYEEMMYHLKLLLMILPVMLLLAVHWLSSEDTEKVPFVVSLPGERDSLHRIGGSPLGVLILLIFLIFMISHHTSFQERWFPLFYRRY
ncbi:OLC1v1006026C1 [Oldenlandia corymbosa var. corymbosa]|uniref:OLC1v1006026C1 n=1 Tax=Oldenlandia corymbosa var. corymbosa TaxID=529605 RepID=A0AAV1DJ04_OLDCO|nr:OLC1v1006026C1 [Oldenlandia corymbosa var. corymbosa]